MTILAAVFMLGVGCSGPSVMSNDQPLQAERVTVYSANKSSQWIPTSPWPSQSRWHELAIWGTVSNGGVIPAWTTP